MPESHVTQQEQTDRSKYKFILTPGLIGLVPLFEDHFNVAAGEPIMIVGPTGVGKTLFFDIAEALFNEETKKKSLHRPFIKANCAHFGGQHSDPNIARGELFGYEKGTFTGAAETKIGLVEQAKGGVLALEEIGELPLEVQAMLLSFIETGEFRRMGGKETLKAKVQIIGATNAEEKLREDFRYRFYPFYVPGLHKRREDMLYYLYDKFPDVVGSLRKWELLALLAYHWPGNVREVLRVGRLLTRGERALQYLPWETKVDPDWWNDRLLHLKSVESSINGHLAISLREKLKRKGVNVKLLESTLNKYRVGLDSNDRAFPKSLNENQTGKIYEERFRVRESSWLNPFWEAYQGYVIFCSLFFQDPDKDKNALDVSECTSIRVGFRKEFEKVPKSLKKGIVEFLSGVNLPVTDTPDTNEAREGFCSDLLRTYPKHPFFSPMKKAMLIEEPQLNTPDIFSKEWKDAEKDYYNEVLQRANGDKAEAARRIGVPYQTFISRLRRVFKEDSKKTKRTFPHNQA